MVLLNIDCHWIKLAQNRDRDHLPAAYKCAVWRGMTSSWLFPPEGAPRALVASAISCSPRRQRLDVECSEWVSEYVVVLLGIDMPVRRGHVAPRTTIIETIIRKFDTHSELQFFFQAFPRQVAMTTARLLRCWPINRHQCTSCVMYLFMANLTKISVAEATDRQIMCVGMDN